MNILITGAKGQLGQELKDAMPSSINCFYTDVGELDLRFIDSVDRFVSDNKITHIINCAAFTNVDLAETEIDDAYLINRDVPANLARIALKYDIALVHISTDYVFDGQANVPYNEVDAVNPQTVYGKSKLAGEEEIRKICCRGIIVRTAWLYSKKYGKNFYKTMLRLGEERELVKVVSDQVGTPTNACDLAKALVDIVSQDKLLDFRGEIFHYSNQGICSWFEFTKEIFSLASYNCQLLPISTAEYPTPTPRPAYSVLSKSKIIEAFGVNVPTWQESLSGTV